MQNAEPPRSPGYSRPAAILADDLTGALDSAAAFIPLDGTEPPFVALAPGAEVPDSAGVVAVNADSRRLPVAEASVVVTNTAAEISRSRRTLRYVKIDSTLRGHPGLEITECAKQVSAALVIVAPSFPATGRTVSNGDLLVHNVPLAETEVGNDPLSPLDTSTVAEILRQSTDLAVHEVSLATVRSNSLSAEMAALASKHGYAPVIVCCDAETDEDLDLLIAAGLSLETAHADAESANKVLFAGSAGLAFALSRAIRSHTSDVNKQRSAPFSEPLLLVTASQRELADRQIAQLISEDCAELHGVEFTLDRSNTPAIPVYAGDAITSALRNRRNVVLRATIAADLSSISAHSIRSLADHVTRRLGQIVASLASQRRLGGIVIIGGDTAHGILTAIEARGIVLAAEPLPGLPVGTIKGGLLDGVPIATKAGAFGDDQTLVKLFQYISHGDQSI